jgi:hypothetical protein
MHYRASERFHPLDFYAAASLGTTLGNARCQAFSASAVMIVREPTLRAISLFRKAKIRATPAAATPPH